LELGITGKQKTGVIKRLLATPMIIINLTNMYSSPNFIRVIKPNRMRWTEHAARMTEMTKQATYTKLIG
jgi:uncharacterized protein YvpB